MENLKEKIGALILLLEEVSQYLYKQDDSTAYRLFNGAIGELAEVINQMYAIKIQNACIEFDEKALMEKLAEALSAMEQNDMILIADIIKYEIIETLENMASQLL